MSICVTPQNISSPRHGVSQSSRAIIFKVFNACSHHWDHETPSGFSRVCICGIEKHTMWLPCLLYSSVNIPKDPSLAVETHRGWSRCL